MQVVEKRWYGSWVGWLRARGSSPVWVVGEVGLQDSGVATLAWHLAGVAACGGSWEAKSSRIWCVVGVVSAVMGKEW